MFRVGVLTCTGPLSPDYVNLATFCPDVRAVACSTTLQAVTIGMLSMKMTPMAMAGRRMAAMQPAGLQQQRQRRADNPRLRRLAIGSDTAETDVQSAATLTAGHTAIRATAAPVLAPASGAPSDTTIRTRVCMLTLVLAEGLATVVAAAAQLAAAVTGLEPVPPLARVLQHRLQSRRQLPLEAWMIRRMDAQLAVRKSRPCFQHGERRIIRASL